MAKKGKKGKKGKKTSAPIIEQFTTPQMLIDRTKMLCPRMGDVYDKKENVNNILADVSTTLIKKVARKQLDKLELQSLKLNELPNLAAIMPELQTLTTLNLSKNSLFNISSIFDALAQMTNVKIVNLSNNLLNGPLPPSAGLVSNLEELYLDGNQITSLGDGIVEKWGKLRHISFPDNCIAILPQAAAAWVDIEVLNAKNNRLTEVPEVCFEKWSKMKKLFLGLNQIAVLPENLGNLDQLVELDLSSNALESLPSSLAMLYELELLHLGNNKLLDFPASIFTNLKKLRELQLYKNKISVIPPEIGNLKSIERLSLGSNQIKWIPDEIGSCVTLKELYLGNNAKLSYFPPSSGHLRNLQELVLYKCPALKQVPTTLLEMSGLRELDLRAVKKNVCKITPECMEKFRLQKCVVRGGVVKKIKADLKAPAGASASSGAAEGEALQPATDVV